MKTSTGILIGCGSILLILAAAFAVGYCVGFGPKGPQIAGESWLVLDPMGEVPDYTELRGSDFWGFSTLSAEDICARIRNAATDSSIKGIIIKPSMLLINFASLHEIGAAIEEFKKSKKPVIAHAEMMGQKDYLLCAMADKVYMDPSASGGIVLEGVASNILFYRDALAKLGVKMHVMQSGEFKGAGEPYTRTSLSPGTEENLRKALKSRYDLIREDIAKLRRLDAARLLEIYENRPDLNINATEAKQYGLIDDTATWDGLLEKYDIDDNQRQSISDYKDSSSQAIVGNQIAIVNLSGNIATTNGFSPEGIISYNGVDRMLDAIEDDSNVKAVVLRVNSPGGSALESESIYQRIKALDIPVVVSMGGMAASGGYYISCAGDYIVADPHTITGSIGVIMALPEAEELGNKLGIESQTISYGKFANFGSIFEKYDEELLISLERNSEAVYTEFKQRVMDARKIGPQEIDAVAEGRVFSAADAKALKLVDEIGGLEAAVKKAAGLAGVTRYSVRQYPKKIGLWDMFRREGMFDMASGLLKARDASLSDRLEAYLARTLQTKQWLYFCPYRMD
jgi:protease-4